MIPPMTDPLSRYWDQPDSSQILVDDVHAILPDGYFERLSNYSCSVPSGVYEGKMWRRREPYRDDQGPHTWYLGWYGLSKNPDRYSVNFRKILFLAPDYEDDGGPLTDRDHEIIERMVPQNSIPGKTISSVVDWLPECQ